MMLIQDRVTNDAEGHVGLFQHSRTHTYTRTQIHTTGAHSDGRTSSSGFPISDPQTPKKAECGCPTDPAVTLVCVCMLDYM